MSQVSGVAEGGTGAGTNGNGGKPSATQSAPGRAVFLLAFFVVLGVGLLHELDKPKASAQLNETKTAQVAQSGVTSSSTTQPARTPAEVKVLVANGVGVAGAATRVSGRLSPVGYQLLKPSNTVATQTASAIYFAPGYQAEAEGVGTTLGIPASGVMALPTQPVVGDLQAANVVVVVGNDLANISAATPTSNAAGSSSTTSSTATSTSVNPLNGPLTRQSSTTAISTTTTATTR